MDDLMIQIEKFEEVLDRVLGKAKLVGKAASDSKRLPDLTDSFSGNRPEKEFYTTEELVEELHVSREKIRWLRQSGLLRGTKLGHGFVYGIISIRSFFEDCAGFDLSTKEKIEAAALVIAKEKEKKKRRSTAR